MLIGVTNAFTDSVPVVAIAAQVGLNRIYKETHQYVDLLSLFKPVTKWSNVLYTPNAVPETIRKVFNIAETERPGATFLAIPEDLEGMEVSDTLIPLSKKPVYKAFPDIILVNKAIEILKAAKNPVMLIGYGAVRGKAEKEIRDLCKQLNIPTATTYMAKGVVSDKEENVMGTIGFMEHDYENFAFDKADVILSLGYELQEFAPSKINPKCDKKIIHINTFIDDIDSNYSIDVAIEANIAETAKILLKEIVDKKISFTSARPVIKDLVEDELKNNIDDTGYPLKPQKIIGTIRKVMGDDEIVLADTGAVKMWMARLYPTYEPNTCMITNGLSTMSYALPGAIGAHFAKQDKKILAVMGDGCFMMNSQEIETAMREKVPLKILIWEDKAYGLIKWKMDIELKTHDDVDFTNPDFVKYAESFGANGYRIYEASELEPTLEKALNEPGVSIVICPVDYRENMKLTDKLGKLTMPN